MTPVEIVALFVIVFTPALAVSVPFLFRREYNITCVSGPEKLLEMVAMQPLTYEQMLLIMGVIYDLHNELRRPWWCRFIRYPMTDNRKEALIQMCNSFEDRMALLDAAYANGGVVNDGQ